MGIEHKIDQANILKCTTTSAPGETAPPTDKNISIIEQIMQEM